MVADLKLLGAKYFYGKLCVGNINHVNIRTLQLILTKICLVLGVTIVIFIFISIILIITITITITITTTMIITITIITRRAGEHLRAMLLHGNLRASA